MKASDFSFLQFNEHTKEILPRPELQKLNDPGEADFVRSRYNTFVSELLRFDAIHLLGISAFYTIINAARASWDSPWSLDVEDLEILQALLLTHAEKHDKPRVTPDLISGIWQELCAQVFVAGQIDLPPGLSEDRQQLAQMVKSHTCHYRNPYGQVFFRDMMRDITAEYDARFDPKHRRASMFFETVAEMIAEIDRRLAQQRARIAELMKGDEQTAVRIAQEIASESVRARHTLSSIDLPSLPLAELRWYVFNLNESRADDLFRFTDKQIRDLAPPEYDPIPDIGACSLEFCQLSEVPIGEWVRSNPAWNRPFIRARDSVYLFCPLTVLSFPFHLFLTVFTSPTTKARLEKVRGIFVESHCEELLREVLPSAEILRNVFWNDESGDRIQSDVLALIDSWLLIFEAKGAIYPDRIRTGNFVKAQSFIKGVYGEAASQSERLSSYVRTSNGSLAFRDENGLVLRELDCTAVRHVARYCISIEQLGPITNAPRLLSNTDVFGPDSRTAPVVMLSELDRILRGVEDERVRLHYLSRRPWLGQHCDLLADELDIATLYLTRGFTEFPRSLETFISLLGASYHLPKYTDRITNRFKMPSDCSLRNSKYFRRVIDELMRRRPRAYLECVLSLIDMPLQAQRAFGAKIGEMRASLRRDRNNKAMVVSFVIDSVVSPVALVGLVYRAGIGSEFASETLAEAIQAQGVTRGLLIGHELGFDHYPYSMIVYADTQLGSTPT